MTDSANAPWWLIAATVVAALVAAVVPLPAPIDAYQPEWLALVVCYWCLTAPERFGPGTAWTCGIVMDALRGSLLGEHALALLLVAFLALRFRLQVRVFPIVQQSLTVAVLLVVHAFVIVWIEGATGLATGVTERAWAVVVSALVWPVIVLAIDHARARSGSGDRVPG
jgi:rod shape-determining protein MreD